ncbi:MAG: beta-ketoacyl-ACP synthase III [Hyphomicrobium sp.]
MTSTLISLGHYAPQRRVPNAEIESRLGLEPGWVARRTGIHERRYAAPDEALSDLAVKAGEMALSRLGFARDKIGLLVLATSTPDHLLPPSAPLVAHRLGLKGAGGIDMAGACGGFLYALTFADSFVRAHGVPVLVIAANILSRRTDPDDRRSVVLFSDGAGAAVVAPSGRPNTGIAGLHLTSDGSAYDLIKIDAGGSRRPFDETVTRHDTMMKISDGRAVFSKAAEMMATSSRKALAAAGLGLNDVDYWVPHQANARIISATALKLGIHPAKTLSSVAQFGNSSAATIPLTLSLCADTVLFKPGDVILMCAAGAGLTGGALVYRM